MASYGRIEEFLPAQGDWITYAERLSYYFEAVNNSNANRKKAVLLSMCGTETFSLLKDLITPNSLGKKNIWRAITDIRGTLQPSSIRYCQRFNLYMCRQQPNQTISDFITYLKNKVLQIWFHYPGYFKGHAGCRCRGRPYPQTFISKKIVEFRLG